MEMAQLKAWRQVVTPHADIRQGKALFIAVANCPNAGMIARLTNQISEYMDENAERAYESSEKVMGRILSRIRPGRSRPACICGGRPPEYGLTGLPRVPTLGFRTREEGV